MAIFNSYVTNYQRVYHDIFACFGGQVPRLKNYPRFKRNQFSFQVAPVYPIIFPVYQIISLIKTHG